MQPTPTPPITSATGTTRRPLRSIGIRIVVITLLISASIGIMGSALWSFFIYKQDLDSATKIFNQIESSYLPSLTDNLWELNTPGINSLLDGLARLPNVSNITLIDESNNTLTRNVERNAGFARREFNLEYRENSSHFRVGKLSVELNDHIIWSEFKNRAAHTALAITIILLINAALVLTMLRQLVIRHLRDMATFATQFTAHDLENTLQLRRHKNRSYDDELDRVVNAINVMQDQLKQELIQRTFVQRELQQHKSYLEILVEQRTLELQSSIVQLEIAADVAQIGIWQAAFDDRVMEWNDRMYEIFGFTAEARSTLGSPYDIWSTHMHPDDAVTVKSAMQRIKNVDEVMETTFRIITAQKETRYVSARSKSVRDRNGDVIKAIGVTYDITAQIEIQNNLRRAKEDADAASAAKSQFLANMSHEIRTPMNAILGMLTLVERTRLDQRQQDYISKARHASKTLLDLLNDILDFSKIESKKLELDAYHFEPEKLWQELSFIVSGLQADHPVEIIYDLPTDLPRYLMGDAARLRQILINLIGNALKFTERGHVLLDVDVITKNLSTLLLRVAVSDTGIGMSTRQMESIFESFKQADTSINRRFGGTGLGLAISNHLVLLMHGKLQVQSEIGKGSRFWFDIELPYAEDNSMARTPPRAEPPAPVYVLLANASKTASACIVKIGTTYGWQINTVDNEAALLQQSANPPLHAIIVDANISGSDSEAAAALLQKLVHSAVPIIVMASAHEHEQLMQQADYFSTSNLRLLLKPATPQQLRHEVEAATTQKSAPRSLAPVTDNSAFAPQRLHGLHILVVEDNALNRQVAKELLQGEGAEVALAHGGLDGVAMVCAATQHYDIVIMDMQMPDIDGLEATRRIRADARFGKLPILAMTANISAQDRAACIAAGMNDHIGKPIDIEELTAAVLRLTQRRAIPGTAIAATDNATGGALPDSSARTVQIVDPKAKILTRLAHNQALFERLLAQFSTDISVLIDALNSAFIDQNRHAIVATLHTIKGNAANLGAVALSQLAAQYEYMLKTAKPESISMLACNDMQAALRTLLTNSAQALAQYVEPVATESNTQDMGREAIDLDAILAELEPLLRASDLHAVEIIETLPDKLGGTDAAWYTAFRHQVIAMDFSAALAALETRQQQRASTP